MKVKFLGHLLALLFVVSCSEYTKVLKINDKEVQYTYAKKYFSEKKYDKASEILKMLIPYFKGTEKGEESLYLLARCYYESKDYVTSGQYFSTYYTSYPRGQYTELARFYNGYGYYLDSPDPELDQSTTYKALSELQAFLDYFPNSERRQEAIDVIFALQEKLALKALLNARLYYNLGNYGGNNYMSCIVASQNALKDYPYSKYKEDFYYLILCSKYHQAFHSIAEKEQNRFREVIDEYYIYISEFPTGKYKKEAEDMYTKTMHKIQS
jgi:outer membrane protein assembly factor BamD